MTWSQSVVERLVATDRWGYDAAWPSATEPAALAAIALLGHGAARAAQKPLQWLTKTQRADGSLGVDAQQSSPTWPTSLAVIAWTAADSMRGSSKFEPQLASAVRSMLRVEGVRLERVPEMGHDSTLLGWPWVEGTHSWIEPTAMHLLALKAVGQSQHPRAREAARLLADRLLPSGGCNYGNTTVLGQTLRPHVQPTGVCLLALARESALEVRVEASLKYLERELSPRTTTASLCYALLALAALDRWPARADALLEAAGRRTLSRDAAPYKLALLALAALGRECPIVSLTAPVGAS